MNTAKKTATATHKTMLAGVGAYDSTREKAADTFDHLFVSGSGLVNELLEKGEEVEAKLYAKLEVSKMLKEKFATLKAKLGLGNDRQDQQLDMLNQRVDSLIDVVAKLAQQKAAEQNTPVKAPAKTAAKPASKAKAKKAPAKAEAKPAVKAKATKTPTKAATKPASKTKTGKAPAKAVTKPADKTAEKSVAKEKVKSADTSAPAKTDSKSTAAKE